MMLSEQWKIYEFLRVDIQRNIYSPMRGIINKKKKLKKKIIISKRAPYFCLLLFFFLFKNLQLFFIDIFRFKFFNLNCMS